MSVTNSGPRMVVFLQLAKIVTRFYYRIIDYSLIIRVDIAKVVRSG